MNITATDRNGRSYRSARRAVLLGAVMLLTLGPLLAAAAADEPPRQAKDKPAPVLQVDSIDARSDSWRISGLSSDGAPSISIAGKKQDVSVAQDLETDTVVVIDNDRNIPNGTVRLAIDASGALAPGTGGASKVGVVTTARQGGRQELELSSDPAAFDSAIHRIQQNGDAATWDAIARAADLLEHSPATSKRVIAFLAAPDKLSLGGAGSAESALRLGGARLDVVALPAGVDAATLDEVVASVGGSVQTVSSDEQLADAAAVVAGNIDHQFVAEMAAPPGDDPTVELAVRAGASQVNVDAQRGMLAMGSAALTATESSTALMTSVLSNSIVRLLMILLLAAAVVGFVWSLLTMVVPDENSLSRRLGVYDEAATGEAVEFEEQATMATVPLLRRAVALTGEVADKRGGLEELEATLERANLPLRAAEAVFFVCTTAVLLGVLAFAFTRNALVGLLVLMLAVMVPRSVLKMKVRLRQKKFVNQLPDMLALLAGTLKAGYSITQGFEAVSKEISEPMGRELRRVVTEHRLGRTLEDALDATAERMDSDDFAWTVMAIKIQREVGGNLAELLMTVANTMTQRERLRRDVASLTAEGRMSAMILGLLPPGLGMVMFVMNREYISQLFTPGLGYVLVGAATIAMAVGFAWMKKIITIEV